MSLLTYWPRSTEIAMRLIEGTTARLRLWPFLLRAIRVFKLYWKLNIMEISMISTVVVVNIQWPLQIIQRTQDWYLKLIACQHASLTSKGTDREAQNVLNASLPLESISLLGTEGHTLPQMLWTLTWKTHVTSLQAAAQGKLYGSLLKVFWYLCLRDSFIVQHRL